MRLRSGLMALCVLAGLPAPALAHGQSGGPAVPPPPMPLIYGNPYGGWSYDGWQQPYEAAMADGAQTPDGPTAGYQGQGYDRDGWLRECRRRLGDSGTGGAVIGGVVGGVAGNVIAGHGDKLVGTIAGAAVGALAGRAIDKAEDAPRARDRCEAMLEGGPGYGAYGPASYGTAPYGYGYGGPVMMVPVMMVPVPQGTGQRQCKETVTTTTEYVTVPRRSRHIPRRAAPDKRVPIG